MLDTQLLLYNVYVLSILLYAAETWTLTADLERGLDADDQWSLRGIFDIHVKDHVVVILPGRRLPTPTSGNVQTFHGGEPLCSGRCTGGTIENFTFGPQVWADSPRAYL